MRYDPILCMMVDDSVNTKDAMFVQLRFSSGRTEGAKLEENEYREYAEALLKKYGEKMVTLSKQGKVIATYLNRSKLFGDSKDSKTIDKAIRSCDSTSKANGYIDAIRGESDSKKAERFVRQAESDDDITDSELNRIYDVFKLKFGRRP